MSSGIGCIAPAWESGSAMIRWGSTRGIRIGTGRLEITQGMDWIQVDLLLFFSREIVFNEVFLSKIYLRV